MNASEQLESKCPASLPRKRKMIAFVWLLCPVMDERAKQQVATRGSTVVPVSLSITLWLPVKTMVLQFMVFL